MFTIFSEPLRSFRARRVRGNEVGLSATPAESTKAASLAWVLLGLALEGPHQGEHIYYPEGHPEAGWVPSSQLQFY